MPKYERTLKFNRRNLCFDTSFVLVIPRQPGGLAIRIRRFQASSSFYKKVNWKRVTVENPRFSVKIRRNFVNFRAFLSILRGSRTSGGPLGMFLGLSRQFQTPWMLDSELWELRKTIFRKVCVCSLSAQQSSKCHRRCEGGDAGTHSGRLQNEKFL